MKLVINGETYDFDALESSVYGPLGIYYTNTKNQTSYGYSNHITNLMCKNNRHGDIRRCVHCTKRKIKRFKLPSNYFDVILACCNFRSRLEII